MNYVFLLTAWLMAGVLSINIMLLLVLNITLGIIHLGVTSSQATLQLEFKSEKLRYNE